MRAAKAAIRVRKLHILVFSAFVLFEKNLLCFGTNLQFDLLCFHEFIKGFYFFISFFSFCCLHQISFIYHYAENLLKSFFSVICDRSDILFSGEFSIQILAMNDFLLLILSREILILQ